MVFLKDFDVHYLSEKGFGLNYVSKKGLNAALSTVLSFRMVMMVIFFIFLKDLNVALSNLKVLMLYCFSERS